MKRILLLSVFLITLAFSIEIFLTENVKAASLEFIDKKKDLAISNNDSLTLAYAANELVQFLKLISSTEVRLNDNQIEVNDWAFRLGLDPSMPKGEWKVAGSYLRNEKNVVRLIGHDASGVLDAVYTLLEKLVLVLILRGRSFRITLTLAF